MPGMNKQKSVTVSSSSSADPQSQGWVRVAVHPGAQDDPSRYEVSTKMRAEYGDGTPFESNKPEHQPISKSLQQYIDDGDLTPDEASALMATLDKITATQVKRAFPAP